MKVVSGEAQCSSARPPDQNRSEMTTCKELLDLIHQFLALVDTVLRLPPGLERRTAFRAVHYYGARIDTIAAKWVRSRSALSR